MADRGEREITVGGMTLRVVWRKAGFGEWLAWSYLPGPDGLHNQGVGFEARADSADAAASAVEEKLRAHLKG